MKRDEDREGQVVTLSLIDGDSLRRSVGSLPTVIRRFRLVAFLDWKGHHASTRWGKLYTSKYTLLFHQSRFLDVILVDTRRFISILSLFTPFLFYTNSYIYSINLYQWTFIEQPYVRAISWTKQSAIPQIGINISRGRRDGARVSSRSRPAARRNRYSLIINYINFARWIAINGGQVSSHLFCQRGGGIDGNEAETSEVDGTGRIERCRRHRETGQGCVGRCRRERLGEAREKEREDKYEECHGNRNGFAAAATAAAITLLQVITIAYITTRWVVGSSRPMDSGPLDGFHEVPWFLPAVYARSFRAWLPEPFYHEDGQRDRRGGTFTPHSNRDHIISLIII